MLHSMAYQNSCKEAMNRGGGQIRGDIINLLYIHLEDVKKALFHNRKVIPFITFPDVYIIDLLRHVMNKCI